LTAAVPERVATREAGAGQLPLWSAREECNRWQLRVSRRSRRLSMRVFPGGRIEVVVPPGTGMPAVERFVARHRDWAERRARELTLQAPAAGSRRPEQVRLALLDREWAVEYRHDGRRRAQWLDAGDGRLQLRLGSESEGEAGEALLKWLTALAGHHLSARLQHLGAELGIDYAQLQLRRQRTRWGSCSTRGTISLNVCLMFQRPEVVRYLMVHELCHRRHMNHSARFWRLVESFEPDWRALDAELLRGWRQVPAWVFT
jgi:predicted metal-dependent hydrolase